MYDILFAIISGLITSFIYDAIKKFLKHKPTKNDSQKYTEKYFRDIKFEFYISFPLGIFFALFSSKCTTDSTYIGSLTLSFFMFFISLMAFICLTEVVNNLSDNNSNENS